jgi:hypothetical protein
MKRIFMLLVLLAMAQGALAEEKAEEKGLPEKAGNAVKKGAEATERGVKKGADATVKGLKKAGEWVGKKMEKGGEKLEKASK